MVKKAVLIGINYKGQEGQLNGCINDVNQISTFLVDNCGYNRNNIRLLTEEQTIIPTRSNIETQIKWLVSNIMQGDTLFFYYSGHGAFLTDKSNDETDGRDEVIIPLDYQSKGVITDDWIFQNMVSKVPANVTLWSFTDCCHSGTMLDLKYNFRSMSQFKNGTVKRGIPYVPKEWNDRFSISLERSNEIQGNVYSFSGCQDSQTSADALINKKHQGAFSYCLFETIKNNVVRMSDGTNRFRSGTIKLRNLLKEINCRLQINGFAGQESQLSCRSANDLERTFDP